MDRRTFLALAAAALGTAGCTSDPDGPMPPPSAPTPQDPDATIRRRVADAEAALIASYRRALKADPALASVLAPLVRHHEEHLALVAPEGATPPSASPSGPAEPRATPTGATPAPATPPDTAPATPPPDPARLLADLAAEESAAQDHRIAACDGAIDPGLARLLCLIGASEAQHARVLERAAEQAA